MPVRQIEIPEELLILVQTDKGEQELEFSFETFIDGILNQDIWVENFSKVRSANTIKNGLSTANGLWDLAEEDWAILKDCIETPVYKQIKGFAWNAHVTRQLMPFMSAVLDAKVKD